MHQDLVTKFMSRKNKRFRSSLTGLPVSCTDIYRVPRISAKNLFTIATPAYQIMDAWLRNLPGYIELRLSTRIYYGYEYAAQGHYKNNFRLIGKDSYIVDHFAAASAYGYFTASHKNNLTCGVLNEVMEPLAFISALFELPVVGRKVKASACIRHYSEAMMSWLCPEYGVAIVGICESYAQYIIQTCSESGVEFKVPYFWNDYNLRSGLSWGVDQPRVVPDNTRLCLKHSLVEVTGRFDKVLQSLVIQPDL
jgi:hypothetical protein